MTASTPPKLPMESLKAYSASQIFLAAGGAMPPEQFAGPAGATPSTIRKWFQQHRWTERIQHMTALLSDKALQQAAANAKESTNQWFQRKESLRATEWHMHKPLIEAAQRALDMVADSTPERPPALTDIARIIDLASKLGRLAAGMPTDGATLNQPESPAVTVDIELGQRQLFLSTDCLRYLVATKGRTIAQRKLRGL